MSADHPLNRIPLTNVRCARCEFVSDTEAEMLDHIAEVHDSEPRETP